MKTSVIVIVICAISVFSHAQSSCLVASYPLQGNGIDTFGAFSGTDAGLSSSADRNGNLAKATCFEGSASVVLPAVFDFVCRL